MKDEALRLALEALKKCDSALAEELAAWDIDPPLHHVLEASNACGLAITAIKEVLAQPVATSDTSQKPVDETTKQRHEPEPVQQEKDWGAVAEKRYSAIRQATRATTEDAVVRAVHKVMQKEPVPVATVYEGAIAMWNLPEKFTGFLYTSPPKREWQGLTDEEADELVQRFARYELLRAIEAKLKEKNT